MASIYPWPEHWWTNTGRFAGQNLTVQAGSIFVPWASEAKPIASGRWKIIFRYSAGAASTVDIKHNPFSKADETAQVGQYDFGEITLSPGVNVTQEVTLELKDRSQPLWTPQFQLKPGQPSVTFHRIEVEEAPAAPPPPQGDNPYDKQYVRDWLTSAESGWDRASGDNPPALPDSVVAATTQRYVEVYRLLTGADPIL